MQLGNRLSLALLACAGLAGCSPEQSAPLPRVSAAASQALDAAVAQQFQTTLEHLQSRNPDTRKAALDAIERHWQRHWQWHRQRVAKLLDDTDSKVRLAATYLLSRLGDADDLPVLRRMLADSHTRVRSQAVKGLLRLEDRTATTALIGLTARAEYEELQVLMQAIASFDPARAERKVLALAGHPEWASRRVAAQTAALMQSPASVEMLERLIADPVWLVRADAIDAIGKRRCHVALEKIRTCTKDQAGRVRSAAITTLGQLGHARDFALAKDLAQHDPVDSVRANACRSLSGYAASDAMAVLESVLCKATEATEVRKASLMTFLAIADPAGRARLQQLIASGDRVLRELASKTLARGQQTTGPNTASDRPAAAHPGR